MNNLKVSYGASVTTIKSTYIEKEFAMLEPTLIPQRRIPRYGFHSHTEKLNGRLAMIAFIALIIVERNIGHGILNW